MPCRTGSYIYAIHKEIPDNTINSGYSPCHMGSTFYTFRQTHNVKTPPYSGFDFAATSEANSIKTIFMTDFKEDIIVLL